IATSIYERHTVLTAFLTALGVDAETAAEDACRIEHVLSEETFDKLKQHAKAYIDAQGK
ncbi:MAG: iron dependent repressor, metal binding and dimerization domain protein, partial [Eubacteriales bacterium]